MLDIIKGNFAKLKFGGFEDQYNEIEEKLTLLSNALDDEVSCKINFDEHYQEVLKKVQLVEAEFIKIKRQYNEAKEYYFIDEMIEQRFIKFQNSAASLSDKKRDFEGFIFSNSRNPYSFMIKKMNLIQLETQEIELEVTFFKNYFINLKNYAEEIFIKENELTVELIKTIGSIRKSNNLIILENFENEIHQSFHNLYLIRQELKQLPIKVTYIKEKFNRVYHEVNTLCQILQQRVQEAQLALQAILYANQLRSEFNEVEKVLQEAECKYQQQQYKETSEIVINILKEYHPAAYAILGGK